jgi:hypothetical protein
MSALQMTCRERREFFRRNAATRYRSAPKKRDSLRGKMAAGKFKRTGVRARCVFRSGRVHR